MKKEIVEIINAMNIIAIEDAKPKSGLEIDEADETAARILDGETFDDAVSDATDIRYSWMELIDDLRELNLEDYWDEVKGAKSLWDALETASIFAREEKVYDQKNNIMKAVFLDILEENGYKLVDLDALDTLDFKNMNDKDDAKNAVSDYLYEIEKSLTKYGYIHPMEIDEFEEEHPDEIKKYTENYAIDEDSEDWEMFRFDRYKNLKIDEILK